MPEPTRRAALALLGSGLLATQLRAVDLSPADTKADGKFVLPPLPYAFGALEPQIDARTMEIHHDKHHAAYVAGLNKGLEAAPELAGKSLEELLRGLADLPEAVRTVVRNHGGGHHNHTLFWQSLAPASGAAPSGALAAAMDARWGSFAAFQTAFTAAAMTRFGSGWAWLVRKPNGQLDVYNLPNQDSPLTTGDTPLVGLDVWEHAYYLLYQNRRADYVAAWWKIVNWPYVASRLTA
ncbi:MAG: superoxide dismutase [Fimbriimonadaceae bacterium]|nr:superoxide dismutase [Fimbriimonadaceae bacterium]